jgi:hypothetical protein
MRKILLSAILFLAGTFSFGQATNPQNTFANAVNINSPSLWMNFNDATTAFKDSVSQDTFIQAGGPTIPNGQTVAGNFNGTSNYLINSSTSALNPTAISVNAWVYISATPSSYNLIFMNANSDVQFMVKSNGKLAIYVAATGGEVDYDGTGSHTLTGGVWYFLSMTYSSTTGLVGYVNGASDGTAAANGAAVTGTGTSQIGYFNSSTTRYWEGYMSDVTVYSAALTPTQIGTLYGGGSISTGVVGQWEINEGSGATAIDSSGTADNMTWQGTASGNSGYYYRANSSSSVSVQQPGFDNTNNANFSAEFPYNAWNAAPNLTLGSTMEWNTPWTMLLHINKLNWDHSGKLMLASKGDTNATATFNNNWQLFIQQNSGNATASQLCFYRGGAAPYTTHGAGTAFYSSQEWCSPTNIDAMPNGFNYDIVVEDSGTGGNSISMWINGIAQSPFATAFAGPAFGAVTLATTSVGSGFTATTAFTSTGGGANCIVAGTVPESGGSLGTPSTTTNQGCTSTPTIVLTSPTGTGGVITATSYPMTMNSPTNPLMVPGYVNAGAFYGSGGTDTSENPLYVDEFAEFPSNLSFGKITNIFYETKFYQGLLYSGLTANPPLLIYESSGCGPDFSGDQSVAILITMAQAGLVNLIGVDDTDQNSGGWGSVGWFRQILDQAGLANVPVTQYTLPSTSYGPNLGGCPGANLTAYNANTPQNPSSYGSSVTMYRTLFAKYPATPIYVMLTQAMDGYAAFQLSPADSISSLTGMQLQQQNYNNGGWVNAFEGNFANNPSGYLSVLNNMGTSNNLPVYFEGGTPANGGPGILVSRTALDPMYQAACEMAGTCTDDVTSGWTNENLAQLISPYFNGGVQLGISGGTGYANTTAFTVTGGGPFCHASGYMVASGGVPVTTYFYNPWYGQVEAYNGAGYGCTPVVFTATGSGTKLTVSTITCCNIGPHNLTPPLLTIGDTVVGTGVPTGTTIVSQTSGTTGGPGVYVTSAATTATTASPLTREPTISLTAPTGTGVVITPSTGIFIKSYEGSATASYGVWPNMWALQSSTASGPFTWFQNSLMDPPTTGQPRSH